jgi:hypothetical protein
MDKQILNISKLNRRLKNLLNFDSSKNRWFTTINQTVALGS